jgi:hypothetical protein
MGASPRTNDIDQIYPNVWQSTFLGNGRPEVPWLTLRAVGTIAGPFHLLALGVFPMAAIWILWASHSGARRAFVCATVGAGVVWLLTPFAVECLPGTLDQLIYERTPVRYGLTFLSLAVLTVVLAAEQMASNERWRVGTIGVLGALLVMQYGLILVNPERGLSAEVMRGLQVDVYDTALFALNVLLLGLVLTLGGPLVPRWTFCSLALAIPIAAGVGGATLSFRWHEGYNLYYQKMFRDEVFDTLPTSGVPDRAKVCVLDDRPYPFFGARRQYCVSVPLVVPDLAGLLRFVEDHKIDFVVVRAGSNPFPSNVRHNRKAPDWLGKARPQLALLRTGPSYQIFRVISPSSTSAAGALECPLQHP